MLKTLLPMPDSNFLNAAENFLCLIGSSYSISFLSHREYVGLLPWTLPIKLALLTGPGLEIPLKWPDLVWILPPPCAPSRLRFGWRLSLGRAFVSLTFSTNIMKHLFVALKLSFPVLNLQA